MAQSGNWFGNLINHTIGMILGGLWAFIGSLLSIFGLWQMSADGVLGMIKDFKMADVKTTYSRKLTISTK